jgi:hypothetical protein
MTQLTIGQTFNCYSYGENPRKLMPIIFSGKQVIDTVVKVTKKTVHLKCSWDGYVHPYSIEKIEALIKEGRLAAINEN